MILEINQLMRIPASGEYEDLL